MKTSAFAFLLFCLYHPSALFNTNNPVAADDDLSSKQIVERYFEAIGGKQLWQETHTVFKIDSSITRAGTLQNQATVNINLVSTERQHRFKSIADHQSGKRTIGYFSEQDHCYNMNGIERPIENILQEVMPTITVHEAKWLLRPTERLADTVVNNIPYYRLRHKKAYNSAGKTYFLIDQETFLLAYTYSDRPEKYNHYQNYQSLASGHVIPLQESYYKKEQLIINSSTVFIRFNVQCLNEVWSCNNTLPKVPALNDAAAKILAQNHY